MLKKEIANIMNKYKSCKNFKPIKPMKPIKPTEPEIWNGEIKDSRIKAETSRIHPTKEESYESYESNESSSDYD